MWEYTESSVKFCIHIYTHIQIHTHTFWTWSLFCFMMFSKRVMGSIKSEVTYDIPMGFSTSSSVFTCKEKQGIDKAFDWN